MILVDLSTRYEGWINDPNRSGIQILGIRSQDPFSGSTVISAVSVAPPVNVDMMLGAGGDMVTWCELHVSVLELYTSTVFRVMAPSSPPTTYSRPWWATTPGRERGHTVRIQGTR